MKLRFFTSLAFIVSFIYPHAAVSMDQQLGTSYAIPLSQHYGLASLIANLRTKLEGLLWADYNKDQDGKYLPKFSNLTELAGDTKEAVRKNLRETLKKYIDKNKGSAFDHQDWINLEILTDALSKPEKPIYGRGMSMMSYPYPYTPEQQLLANEIITIINKIKTYVKAKLFLEKQIKDVQIAAQKQEWPLLNHYEEAITAQLRALQDISNSDALTSPLNKLLDELKGIRTITKIDAPFNSAQFNEATKFEDKYGINTEELLKNKEAHYVKMIISQIENDLSKQAPLKENKIYGDYLNELKKISSFIQSRAFARDRMVALRGQSPNVPQDLEKLINRIAACVASPLEFFIKYPSDWKTMTSLAKQYNLPLTDHLNNLLKEKLNDHVKGYKEKIEAALLSWDIKNADDAYKAMREFCLKFGSVLSPTDLEAIYTPYMNPIKFMKEIAPLRLSARPEDKERFKALIEEAKAKNLLPLDFIDKLNKVKQHKSVQTSPVLREVKSASQLCGSLENGHNIVLDMAGLTDKTKSDLMQLCQPSSKMCASSNFKCSNYFKGESDKGGPTAFFEKFTENFIFISEDLDTLNSCYESNNKCKPFIISPRSVLSPGEITARQSEMMRQIKPGLVKKQKDQQPLKAVSNNWQVTQTVGYLQLIMNKPGHTYDTSKSLEDNLREFFQYYQSPYYEKFRLLKDMYKNDHFIQLAKKIIEAEEANKEMYVFYHAAEERIGIIYDIYSEFRRQLMRNPNVQVDTLRGLDYAFNELLGAHEFLDKMLKSYAKVNEEKQATKEEIENIKRKYEEELHTQGLEDDKIKEALKGFDNNFWIKLARDSTIKDKFNYIEGYQDAALSSNNFLFGSYPFAGSYTWRYFTTSYSESPPPLEKILRTFLSSLGIDNKKVEERVATYKNFIEKMVRSNKTPNGRLMQFFIHPDKVDDFAYMAEVIGDPVYLDVENESGEIIFKNTAKPSETLSVLRKNPELFEKILKKNKDKFHNQGTRKEWKESEFVVSKVLEARLFLKPDILQESKYAKVIDYQVDDKKYPTDYMDQIKEMVIQDLGSFLENSPINIEGKFYKEPKLQSMNRIIHKGTTGEDKEYTISQKQFLALFKLSENDYVKTSNYKSNRLPDNKLDFIRAYLKKNPKEVADSWLFGEAVKNDDLKTLDFLIEEYSGSINTKNSDQQTALSIAVELHKWDIVKRLLKSGANVQSLKGKIPFMHTKKRTLLIKMVEDDNLPAVEWLLQQFHNDPEFINAQNSEGRTALALAIEEGKWASYELLMKYGADPKLLKDEILDRRGHATTFLIKMVEDQNLPAIKVLLKEFQNDSAYLNAKNEKGDTALSIAESRNYKDIISLLSSAQQQ